MGLLDTLSVSNSGLNVNQTAMDVVGHNIANAQNEDYTRQRVELTAKTPFHTTPGDIGTGAKVAQIVRIHDEFIYQRLTKSSGKLEYDTFSKNVLQEAAEYFPDVQDNGLFKDLKNYFDSWNNLASHPNDTAQKTALVQSINTFTKNISESRNRLERLQDTVNDQIKISIDEVNRLGKRIADINKQISAVEVKEGNNANDLRDERDKLEKTMRKLLDFSVFKGQFTSDNKQKTALTDTGKNYNLNIAGYTIVDGTTFHPLEISNEKNPNGFYSISYVRQDLKKTDITGKITGGKIGAMLDLRGRDINPDTKRPNDGTLQKYLDDLDSFAKSFIDQTNTIYAKSAKDSLHSKQMTYYQNEDKATFLGEIKEGEFDVVVYNEDGDEVARRTITIDKDTKMNSATDPNSIVAKLNEDRDDNGDNDSTNDFDDLFKANYIDNVFTITPKEGVEGYKVAIEDKGTNFAAVSQLGALLEGDSAKNISLKREYAENPEKIEAYKAPVEGNNEVANEMVQLQYDQIDFKINHNDKMTDTFYGFYSYFTSNMASNAENAKRSEDTSLALYNTVYKEFQSISGVNIDEELTNLIKYQTGYKANAKVITTIDKMLDVLLGIKQ
ncbi:MAG: flagellar hook-associated protein FlgK [Epsilonproteobacteria bacterium]|nr:flagellar hook-associated protein FlgK [Campylobacterota bacterium]